MPLSPEQELMWEAMRATDLEGLGDDIDCDSVKRVMLKVRGILDEPVDLMDAYNEAKLRRQIDQDSQCIIGNYLCMLIASSNPWAMLAELPYTETPERGLEVQICLPKSEEAYE